MTIFDTDDLEIEARCVRIEVRAPGRGVRSSTITISLIEGSWEFGLYPDAGPSKKLRFEEAEAAVAAASRYLRMGLDVLDAKEKRDADEALFFEAMSEHTICEGAEA